MHSSMKIASGLFIFLLAGGVCAQSATPLQVIHFSADIETTFPGDGGTLFLSDHGVLDYDLDEGFADGSNYLGDLGPADIDAYHDLSDGCGPRLFSVDITTDLGGLVVRPADIVNDLGSIVLDGIAEGIPDGVDIDAVSRDPDSCLIVFSIDVTADFGGATYRPGDLIGWDPGSGFSLYRVDNFGVDIDALHLLEDGRYLISTTTEVDYGDLTASDDQVVEVIPGGPGSFQVLAFDPAALDASWGPADLDALAAERRVFPGTIRWVESEVSVLEDAGSISLDVERVGGSDGAVDVDWASSSGTATEGVDYNAGSGTLNFADGDTSFGVVVVPIDDALLEGDETFTVALSNPTNGAALGSPSVITVTIIDDEDFIFADGFED
ncbi:Calx-beta domain-containing protein [Halomonas denitrificans]|nr:hypothetical protein [Halomonas denitrificans]